MSDAVLGLRTALYYTRDLAASRAWFTSLLGVAPYFDEPFYVGFSVAGYELGVVPDEARDGSCVALWGVDDVAAAIARAVGLGATVLDDATDVGGGIVTGAVRAPQGHVVGFIHNPHFSLGG